jgi:hypothetical protein
MRKGALAMWTLRYWYVLANNVLPRSAAVPRLVHTNNLPNFFLKSGVSLLQFYHLTEPLPERN